MSQSYELAPCPICGSRVAREIATADDVRSEIEALWAFHDRRLEPGTPPERLVDRVAFSQAPAWRLARCEACGAIYRNPREREEALRALYAGEAPSPDAMRALLDTQRAAYAHQAERLTDVAADAGVSPGRGLEIGSYVGGFLEAAAERGWRFEGVDVNAETNAFARALGHRVHDGEIADISERCVYDAVAIWNCLDQMAQPRETLAAARRVMRDGAIVAVRVPNAAFYDVVRARLGGPLGAVARALLAHNNLLGFPYRQALGVESATRLMTSCGFDVVRVVGDALVPIADEWTRGWAALEERALKRVLRVLGAAASRGAPWIEIYAIASPGTITGR